MARDAWTDEENDLTVEAYFQMLEFDLSGQSYNKAEQNRALQLVLPDRSRGAIEFKHQNISAVLLGLGQPWIPGYKPHANFQLSLVDAVLRQLDRYQISNITPVSDVLAEASDLYIGPAPTFANAPPPIDAERMAHIARRYNVAERDAANRKLGVAGEDFMVRREVSHLTNCGRQDLAEKVRWTAKLDGDGVGYDIHSYEPTGDDRLIEVKTTNGWERTPFHITQNEVQVADLNRDSWVLVRLYDFARTPKAFEIRPPLEAHVKLTPTSFLASLG